VSRGDLGCFVPCSLCSLCAFSPFVSGSVAAGAEILGTETEPDVLSGSGLLTEEDLRFVRDLVPSVDLSRTGSTAGGLAASFASSNVS
jgi:hypothetical protein